VSLVQGLSLSSVRRRVPHVAVAAGVLALAACMPFGDRASGDPSPHQVLAVGFENLSDRYIEQVSLDKASLAGLKRLNAFDPEIGFARSRGMMRLSLGGNEVAARPEPGPNDALGWAWLAGDMVEAARRASPRLARHSIDDLYDAVFAGVFSGLDAYTRYAGPTAARRSRESREGFGGIGVTIEIEDGETRIAVVHPGTPAANGGVERDDVITHVDGEPIHGLSQVDVVTRLRGPVGIPVRITVKRKGRDAPLALRLERSHVVPPTVIAQREGDVLTMRLTSFNQRTALSLDRELRAAIREANGRLAGIVLDLRGNPGGLLDQAIEVSDLFLGSGRVVTTRGRHPDSNQTFDSGGGEPGEAPPMVVLVNGRSASSAEIVAAALADRRRAVIVGSTTYGKGTVQTIVRLPNSGEITLTWSRLFGPSGRTINEAGVAPTICTAGGNGRSAALIAALRGHRATVALLTQQPVDANGACPRDTETHTTDTEIARLLLADRQLYTALVGARRPFVAER
jgi:carboxyl-terminal processing protease